MQHYLILATAAVCGCVLSSRDHSLALAADAHIFYVAPQSSGEGFGTSEENAANFRDPQFWARVGQAVQERPVTVNFLDGQYVVSSDADKNLPTLALSGLGSKDHTLTIQGASNSDVSNRGVVFTRHADDSRQGKKGPGLLTISRSQNIIVRNLHFTSPHPIGYATHFGENQNVLIQGCSWIDMPGVYYGATGTSGATTDHITYRDCVFKRIGSGGHAHMAYNAYDPQHIRFINCHFEDCAGDYVRFRDGTDYGVVAGCTFKSTGTYRNANMPFITVPLFNDDDPAAGKKSPNYEYFGTHFLIYNNTFTYDDQQRKGTRVALLFHHSGYDPPGRNHLLTPEQSQHLDQAAAAQKRTFLSQHLGIDALTVHFSGNGLAGVELPVAYRSGAAYGAKSKGWNGIIDITAAVNARGVVTDTEQALSFFD